MTDCYLPRLGGIEVQVRDLAVRLVQAGHEVEVFTTTLGSQGERRGVVEVRDGIPIHRLAIRLPQQLPWNPWAAGQLRRRLEAGGFDVGHVHMGILSPFTLDCTRVALDYGLPVTMTWHCMLGPVELPFTVVRAFRTWAARGVAMNAVSAVAAQPVQRVIGDAGQVHVLPNGIEASTWWQPPDPASPREPAPHQDGLQVITAMRLAPRKRPLALLSVVRRARELVPDLPVRLTVLGEGRLLGRMQRRLERDGMTDWVELAGRVSRPELLARYARSHVYLSPARLESFGIAALEARCVGLPVVGLNTSGAVEFVHHGVNGLLARDDQGMAVALAQLLSDHELRHRMFQYNVSTPPVQDWSTVLDLTLAEYERARALSGVVPVLY